MSTMIYSVKHRQVKDFTVWRMRYQAIIISAGALAALFFLVCSTVATGTLAGIMAGAVFAAAVVTTIIAVATGIKFDERPRYHVFWPQVRWLAWRGWTTFNEYHSSWRTENVVQAIKFYQCVKDSHDEFPEIDTLTRLYVTQGGLYERYLSLGEDYDRFSALDAQNSNSIARESLRRILKDQKNILAAMQTVDVAADNIRDKERVERALAESSVAELNTKSYTSDVDQLTEDARAEAEIAKQYILSRDS